MQNTWSKVGQSENLVTSLLSGDNNFGGSWSDQKSLSQLCQMGNFPCDKDVTISAIKTDKDVTKIAAFWPTESLSDVGQMAM